MAEPSISRIGVLIRRGKDTRDTCAKKRPRDDTGDGAICKPRRGLRRNQPHWHLDLRLPVSRTGRM